MFLKEVNYCPSEGNFIKCESHYFIISKHENPGYINTGAKSAP